jgi:putative tricarboxylic transport membrane protein
MLELLGTGILTILHWKYMLPLLLGTFAGVIGGSLPGFTITLTVIVILPFTYGLDPLAGLAAMTGVYVGGSTGGLITACLLGIPGTPSAIATTFDGFPMARNGEPGRAIWLGVWASVWGGLLGALFLVFVTGPLAAIALEFGPWEYFSLFVLAMAMVAGLTEASLLKGLVSTAIGLLITVIGTDPIGSVPRFTFGSAFVSGGFPFLPVLIGIFAFAQIMTDIEKLGASRISGSTGRSSASRSCCCGPPSSAS